MHVKKNKCMQETVNLYRQALVHVWKQQASPFSPLALSVYQSESQLHC